MTLTIIDTSRKIEVTGQSNDSTVTPFVFNHVIDTRCGEVWHVTKTASPPTSDRE